MPSGSGASVKRPYYLSEYICFVLPFTKSRQPKGNVDAPKNIETADIIHEESITEDLETEELETQQLGSPKIGNYKNNQGRNDDIDDEQWIPEEFNEPVSNIIVSQTDSLEKNDSGDPKQKTQKRSVSSSSVPSVNNPKRNKTTPNPISLADVNKSAFEFFEKKKQAPYKPPAFTNDDADVQFLLSLLPDLKKMSDKQKRKYKVGVLNLAGEILDEPVVSHISAPLFSPTSSYSSLAAEGIPSEPSTRSSSACTSSIRPQCETADSRTYEDISFSTVRQTSTQAQDTLLPNIQYNNPLLPDHEFAF
ncbi:unnamed protein product [Acanthoscelides obtectus]|uniref:BESS domain-containing protein n=1 Tax=Acanthoscelides obtectus TaxID=200917 RepID=A0A9P0VSA8_ACAOB|nr:unnamed protein product [Acanthoscelides obtectus]CAH2018119.1 unnamed protein product [Acanthoscelides obtectus]CAK1649195.1 hypothetical protein AOBTE_LOCUS16093 [Acanthoscelides obtectus]CAK1687968.1 hypothetical protein AOBTE_LOCUS36481 [Acanthoscelides obtectus]